MRDHSDALSLGIFIFLSSCVLSACVCVREEGGMGGGCVGVGYVHYLFIYLFLIVCLFTFLVKLFYVYI